DNAAPGAQAAGGTLTCTTTSVQLMGTGNGTFAWTGPNGFTSNDQNPVVNTAGTYNLVVTGANGCTSQASAVVELDNAAPGAQAAGGTLTCSTTSVQLMGTGNGTFAWTGPNGFTSNDQNPVVNTAGTYNLVVTGANGCTSQASAVVELDNAAPGAQAAGGTLTCTTTSVQLMGTGNGTFAWTGPNGFTSNDQNPVVSTAGTYNLVVTGANGCTSQASAVVELDNAAPGAQAAGGTLTCTNTSVQLLGSGNGTFAWTGPNGFISNDQNPVVSTAGTYNLVVTGANGCTSQASAVVELDNAAPGAQAAGGVLNCTNNSVQLLGTGNGTFAWTGPDNFTSSQQNPVVGMAGIYVLTVTGANGCTSMAEAVVEQDDQVPGAQAIGGTLTCTTTSVQLLGSGNGTFAWTGPNGFASNDQNPVVNTAGTYNLVVTGANGCTSQASAVVELDNAAPGAQAAGGTLTCTTTSVQLMGTGNGTFAWTGPNGFTSNDQNPVVNTAGTYNLVVTGANGCTSQASAVVELDNAAPGAQAAGGTLTCTTTSVQLMGTGNGTFAWTGPNGFTSNDQNPVVSTAGTYNLVVTGANGCTSQASAVVELDNAAPGAQAAGGVLNCTNNSVQLQGTGNGTFAWTGPNGFTSNDQNPVVNTAGTYNLVVTGANGCTSQASAVVELDNAAPGAQAAGGTLTCTTTSVQLMGTGNGTFAWTGPNGFTSNDQNPVVSTAGTYNLVVTGANGCTSQASAVVELDNAAPGAQAAGGTLTCTTTSVQLLGTGNGTFAWTGPNGFTSNDQNPVVNTAGTYNLVVTGANGCTSEATTVVEMDNAAPVAIAYGGSLTCDASSVQLTGIGTGTFSWVGPNGFSSTDANPIVDVAGIYTLTVTGENGCSATAATDVTDATGDLQLTTQGGEVPCSGDGVTISASADGEVEYTWTGPLGFTGSGPEVLVYDEGVYTVVATADGGCTATAEVVVTAEICNKECGPIITWCPPPMEVACGTSLEPDSIGYPGIRKDKDCPTVVFITYSDVTLGYCPQTVTRTWTLSDETGATEYCTQVFTVIDNVAPVLHNVPGNITVSCDAVPDKDDAVWAEDACQPTADVYICDVVEGLDNKCSYTITRTYYAMDYCGNFSSATQTIHVIDDSAPVFDCDLASEVIADCKDIPVKTDCQAWDACDASVDVTIEEAYGYDDKSKECYLVRTYTATDDCGNASTMSQTIHLVGECCDHKGKGDKKLMEVSVSPNPFRTECVISFRALEAGRATVTITDLNGRPVSSAITQDVSAGQDVRIPFSAAQVEMGVYQFRVIIGDRTATGRLIVQ
ncbi:MAG: T9SS type A sorting domain-containing protein, partial [Flavobacteriales bacterium]|nr:T9SS type A sorting domain-containing protein [Flavobacteriales bacterium]